MRGGGGGALEFSFTSSSGKNTLLFTQCNGKQMETSQLLRPELKCFFCRMNDYRRNRPLQVVSQNIQHTGLPENRRTSTIKTHIAPKKPRPNTPAHFETLILRSYKYVRLCLYPYFLSFFEFQSLGNTAKPNAGFLSVLNRTKQKYFGVLRAKLTKGIWHASAED